MKNILALVMGIPSLLLASHSVDVGGFYSIHKEPRYKYNLGGLAISYEIGNSKGLKATGKILTSTNSDLMFIQSHSSLKWYMPYENFEFVPFWGILHTHHHVVRKEHYLGVLGRTYLPVGMGFRHTLGEVSYEVNVAHQHPIAHTYIIDENTPDFWGRKLYLPHAYFADVKLSYEAKDRVSATLFFRWTSDYRQTMRELLSEIMVSMKF